VWLLGEIADLARAAGQRQQPAGGKRAVADDVPVQGGQ
jgi:hypothetical protein